MTEDLALRFISLCLALAGAETLHGIARASILVPKIGKQNALKVSIVTGSMLAFGICFLLVPGIRLEKPTELLCLGLFLALFMASFDIALAKLILRLPWGKVLKDFDPRTGNYLLFGLIGLVFWPYVVMQIS